MNKKHLWATIFSIVAIAIIAFVFFENSPQRSEIAQAPVLAPATDHPIASGKISDQPAQTAGSDGPFDIKTNLGFSFPEYPDVHFKIVDIKKTYDPTADYAHFASGIEDPSLLTVDIQIENNGDKKINANYLQVIYTVATDSGNQTRVAPYYIHTSYESDPLSSTKISPTFIIPGNQIRLSLAAGIYPPINYDSEEDLLSRSTDAFLVDFSQMKAWHPQG